MKELKQKYDFKEVEEGKYQKWLAAGYYNAVGEKSGKVPYCMVIPPPNVTGILHLGHAWNTTLQDMIARYKRLNNYDVLWMSGMDHAGIATQAKIEERLRTEGKNKYEMGREKFLEVAWQWKEEYADLIRKQWAKLGLSLDYSRERFTLDEGLSAAVTKVFVTLYEEGLIYRGERIINWDVEAMTALSNIEVIHKEVEGAFYTFRYPVVGTTRTLLVATTRPETMFGDVCVVVNPADKRYQDLIGMLLINPANHEEIPIIADSYVDMEFGTGAMKCTPAHDPNDFALAERHNLKKVLCMNPDGTMNENAGKYKGMDRFQCREELVRQIEAEGNLEKIEKHLHAVGHSERTDSIVEPYMSKQWFVKMQPLAEDVLQMQNNPAEKINFYPKRFEKTFNQWLENIEDWCISRQLWWGHSIPAWYHKETGAVYVGYEAPQDKENYIQDEDVLDTWFSSALWPFSTLGWPEETADFKRYYPNNVLVTAYDIIFFWVARMAFQGKHFTGERPFEDALIHGLIRDAEGRKMSKSLGNGVDPMEVIDTYGVDALRFFLTTNSTPGQDTRYIEEKVESSWNFINKIWNAARYVIMNLPETLPDFDARKSTMIDEWILSRLNETIEHVNINMEHYEFALVGNELYGFVWDDFCSWYIELSKANLNSDDQEVKDATISTLYTVMLAIIKLLHPFMPFVTEEIYLALPHAEDSIQLESWPEIIVLDSNNHSLEKVEQLLSIISTVREIRAEYQLKPKEVLQIQLFDENKQTIPLDSQELAILQKMANIEIEQTSNDEEKVVRPLKSGSLHISLADLVDVEGEISSLEKEKTHLESEIKRAEGMLANPNFTDKAPREKVDAEKEKLTNYQQQFDIVSNRLQELKEKN